MLLRTHKPPKGRFRAGVKYEAPAWNQSPAPMRDYNSFLDPHCAVARSGRTKKQFTAAVGMKAAHEVRSRRHKLGTHKVDGALLSQVISPANPAAVSQEEYARRHARQIKRLRAEPTRDAAGVVIDFKIWEQDVMNEALHRFARPPSALQRLARVPSSGSGDCHPMDADCREFPTPTRPNSHGQRITARWWLPSARNRSVWLASAARRDGSCDASEHLIAHTEIGEGVRAVVVPQSAAGRVCGQRKVVLDDLRDAIEASREAARGHGHAREGGGHGHDTADAADGRAHGRAMAPLPCSAYRQPAFLLDQEVLHAQFTNYFTRQHIFYALHWWRHEKSNEKSHAHPNASAPTSERHANTSAAACAVHQNGTLGVMLGSSVADHALLCAPPEANPNVTCPCCWRPPPAYDYRTRALVGCPHWNPNW